MKTNQDPSPESGDLSKQQSAETGLPSDEGFGPVHPSPPAELEFTSFQPWEKKIPDREY